jgi:methyl-accepting chemotaxis protein
MKRLVATGPWPAAWPAINKSFCIVEMAPDGILHANPNFLRLMGYRLADLKGRHHAILCFDDFAQSWDYRRFWNELLGGHHVDNRQLRRPRQRLCHLAAGDHMCR